MLRQKKTSTGRAFADISIVVLPILNLTYYILIMNFCRVLSIRRADYLDFWRTGHARSRRKSSESLLSRVASRWPTGILFLVPQRTGNNVTTT